MYYIIGVRDSRYKKYRPYTRTKKKRLLKFYKKDDAFSLLPEVLKHFYDAKVFRVKDDLRGALTLENIVYNCPLKSPLPRLRKIFDDNEYYTISGERVRTNRVTVFKPVYNSVYRLAFEYIHDTGQSITYIHRHIDLYSNYNISSDYQLYLDYNLVFLDGNTSFVEDLTDETCTIDTALVSDLCLEYGLYFAIGEI